MASFKRYFEELLMPSLQAKGTKSSSLHRKEVDLVTLTYP